MAGPAGLLYMLLLALSLVGRISSLDRRTKDLLLPEVKSEEEARKKLEEVIADLEVVESLAEAKESSRDSRALLKKLSFLAGLRTGSIISSTGSFSASNTVRIFGKVMNTALSLSYGQAGDLNPLPVIIAADEPLPPELPSEDSSAEVVDNEPAEVSSPTAPAANATTTKPPKYKIETSSALSQPQSQTSLLDIRNNFIKHHNAAVSRINHKYLRNESTGRSS